jgi:PKD repeat protein
LLFISDFNADIPTSFLGFLVFYTIARNTGLHENIYPGTKTVLLIVIFASSAANTKMAGIYILAASLGWIVFKIYMNRNHVGKNEIIKSVASIVIILAISSFWYLIKPVDMFNGLNQSPYLPSSYYERFTNAVRMLFFSFGPVFSLFLLFTVLFSLFNNDSKYIVITIIAPVLLMWIFFFSYDFRNLSIAIPFIAYAAAYGLDFICKSVLHVPRKKTTLQMRVPSRTERSLRNTQVFKILFILLSVSIILIVNTNAFFNFGINLSYFFYKIYFRYYRIVYTFEHGYYKYVEYFAGALSILSGLLLALFVFRKSTIKILHIVIFIVISTMVLNFTFLTKEKLFSRQKTDTEMLTAHNLYYRIHSYVNSVNNSIQIISNYKPLNDIIFPKGIELKYSPNINHEILDKREDKRYTNYLLLEKKLLNETILKRIEQNLADNHSSIQFNDDEFLFTKR